MSERLEEAEGGAESQFNINRNRDAELMKLRKLLDDIHLESEESAHLLKKKHQEIVNDFQEQVDILTKAKSRWVVLFTSYSYCCCHRDSTVISADRMRILFEISSLEN